MAKKHVDNRPKMTTKVPGFNTERWERKHLKAVQGRLVKVQGYGKDDKIETVFGFAFEGNTDSPGYVKLNGESCSIDSPVQIVEIGPSLADFVQFYEYIVPRILENNVFRNRHGEKL